MVTAGIDWHTMEKKKSFWERHLNLWDSLTSESLKRCCPPEQVFSQFYEPFLLQLLGNVLTVLALSACGN